MSSFDLSSLLDALMDLVEEVPSRFNYKCEFMRVLCVSALNYSERPLRFRRDLDFRFNVNPKTFQDLIYVMADNDIPFVDITRHMTSDDIKVFCDFCASQTYRDYLIDKIINKLDSRRISFTFEGRRYTYPTDFTPGDILMYHNRRFIETACEMYIDEFLKYLSSNLGVFFAAYCWINEFEPSDVYQQRFGQSYEDDCGFYQNITNALKDWKNHH